MATGTREKAEKAVEKSTNKEKLDASKVKVGDVMAITHYVKVQRVDPGNKLVLEDLNTGGKFMLEGKDLIEQSASADQYATEKKVTKTEAAEILVASHNTVFTVCFTKADGEKRVLRGSLVSTEPLLGRSYCLDRDIPRGEHSLRQADHRSIEYLIVNNVKYTVK